MAGAVAGIEQIFGQPPALTRLGQDAQALGEEQAFLSAMGDSITISAEGDGAETAVTTLCELVEAKFGED
jgi:hypothetical protein